MNYATGTGCSDKSTIAVWEYPENGATVSMSPPRPIVFPGRDLFDIEIVHGHMFRLIPKNGLAKSLAQIWMHSQPCGIAMTMLPSSIPCAERGQDITHLEFEFHGAPILATGRDNLNSGRKITPDEARELVKHLEKMRKRKAVKR